MHARFADPEPASPDSVDNIEEQSLEARIEHFKQNPNNMAMLHEFIDEVAQRAEAEANRRALESQKLQQGKEKRPNFKNGKVVNRARGFVVRIFDAICNCANNNAAAATTRFKLRSSSGGGGAASAPTGGKRQQSADEPETLMLSKKKPAAEGKKKSKGVTMAEDVEAGARLVE
ncbi:hypothetical protein AWZ03_008320 [Drosophila navojoa]|uniref:Uncharacterized protein n=1 Tax=Drosophila navojoa TaxID=7232 RepID=A0A484B973_DRONA|nr:uncharacterized protein LOC108651387 isoform X2 [Drosophila navojoa]TDG45258.1 hypothetical protein AWZ03_008320 [Drosophila navojoa]